MTHIERHIQSFWNWFSNHKAYFEQTPHDQFDPAQLHALNDQLSRIAQGLTFEFSVMPGGNTIELAISADSKVALFPLVKQVVASAPRLPNWQVVAFKQAYPDPDNLVVKAEGLTLAVSKMFFYPLANGERVDVILYTKHADRHPRQKATSLALVLTANLLGEYRDSLYVGTYDLHDLSKLKDHQGLRPLRELPTYLDNLYQNQN